MGKFDVNKPGERNSRGQGPSTEQLSPEMDAKLETEARQFLEETLGIAGATQHAAGSHSQQRKAVPQKPWTCLSCLLTQVYQLFCRAGPEGDAMFF